jgi:hypothetical protein
MNNQEAKEKNSQNLNLGVKSLGWNLDFRKFRIYLKEKYGVSTAYLFIGYVYSNQDLYNSLQKAGYVLSFKPTIPDSNGDANLVLQAMIDYNNYNQAVIVTSDGDFYCLVKYLYENNKLLKVISPYTKTCSNLLKQEAKEKLVFMDNLQQKLAYKKKNTA